MTTTSLEERCRFTARLAACRALRLGARLVAVGIVAVLVRPHAFAAEREAILFDALRAGWKPFALRNVDVRVADGVLLVRPNDRTRLSATAGLRAGASAAIDARACSYLTFEMNTLPGSAGSHRAPLLRVGLSDASGRTRFPLLSRFLQLDTDPGSWQQAFIPLDYLIDRGVRTDAITTVMWQYAGPAAPFAVRRMVLIGTPVDADGGGDGHANLLADPSFETRTEACAVWPLVGDCRDLSERGERTLERRGGAADGKRYLCLRGSSAFFFEALAPAADSVGFSVALRAPQEPDSSAAATASTEAARRSHAGAGQGPRRTPDSGSGRAAAPEVEVGCEVVGFGRGGGISVGGRAVRRVPLEGAWRRHAVSGIVHLEDMPPDEAGLRLYRGWVRPLSPETVVHVDAAHLSPAPVDAATFRSMRANALAAGTGIYRQVRRLLSARYLTEDRDRPEPPRLQAELPPFRVPLIATEWAGRAWATAIASGSVPIPRGRVYSPDALRLRGPDGNDLPFQCDVLRRDPRDGSVRCLWVALRTPLEASRSLHCTLESGATLPAQDLPVAAETTDGVLLNTGLLRARLSRQRFVLFDEADWAGEVVADRWGAIRLELLDGRVLSSATPPTQVAVERNGPLNAVVVVRGFLSPADDQPAPRFRYEARVRAWRGVPGVQVSLAVTNLTPQPAVPVRSLALVVPMRRSSQVHAAVGQENGTPVQADLGRREWIRVTQRRDPFRSRQEDLFIEGSDTAPVTVPGRAAGWASWHAPGRPAMTIAFGHMADRHPAALEIRSDSLLAYLLPPSGVHACDFPFGLSVYAEVWVGAVEPPEATLDRLERPPLLSPDRAHLVTAGVFPGAPSEESRLHFPLLDWLLGRELAVVLEDRERTGASGWLEEGESTGGQYGSPDRVAALYRHYLRTGEPRVWERAHRLALHLREVGTWWANEASAFPNPPAAGIETTYQADIASVDTTGLLYDYWFTGDSRSLDVAEALSSTLLLHASDSHLRSWERARVLLGLAELYAATGRRVYREAMVRQLGVKGASKLDLPSGGATVVALAEALDSLGGADLEARFRRELATLAAAVEASHPVGAVLGPEEAYVYQGLSLASPDQLSGTVWNAATQRLFWTFLAPHGQDVSLVRALNLIPAIAASGVTPPGWADGRALGLGPYSGQNRTFTLRIHRQANEPVSIVLCRMRAAHPDPSRRYRLRFMLRDPLRRVLESELLEGETLGATTITLPRRGLNGDYSLTIACEEDGLAEIIATHPRVYLRADEWKAARFTEVSSRFVLRAPRRGDVVILLRGPVARGGGSLAAATLSVPAEASPRPGAQTRILSRARWAVPVAGTGADGRPAFSEFPAEGLRLSVPPEFRGKPLALSITTPRSVEWRVVGLDEPWLAATAAAFP